MAHDAQNKNDKATNEENTATKPKRILKVKKKKTVEPAEDQKSTVAKKKVVLKKKKKIVIRKDKDGEQQAGAPAKKQRPAAKPAAEKKAEKPGQKPAKPAEGDKKEKQPHHKTKKDYAKAKKEARDQEHQHQEERVLARIAKKKRQEEEQADRFASVPGSIDIMETVSVGELAKKMRLKSSDLIQKFLNMGMMVRVNDLVDADTATIIADEFNCKVNVVSIHDDAKIEVEEDKAEDLKPRPPVVTIMGHVDHGKTKLLDAIRASNIVDRESGGITQNIGAYSVKTASGQVTFIDTPGHEAFTMMRARGAQSTDIVILVVAADDGVMPQTVEAINHAKQAEVPIIIAVNKMDIPGVNPEKVKSQLSEYGLSPEEWGGDTLFVYVSALNNEGIDELLETILLQAEMLELKANPKRHAVGIVLESSLDVGRGPVGTILVQKGTLHVGDFFLAGQYSGKVRAMFDDLGKRVKEAPPSTPVEVLGFESPPEAGEIFHVLEDEKEAKNVADKRKHLKQVESAQSVTKVTLDNLFEQIKEGEKQDFKVIIKADVQGSVEALKESLKKLENDKIRFTAIHGAPGTINNSDLMLAETSNAAIIAYRIRPASKVKQQAEEMGIEIKTYDIIYEAIEDIERSMLGMLEAEKKEVETATIEVRDTFRVTRVGTVAGCYVTSGKVDRNNHVRLIRDSVVVYNGKIDSLKRFKDDVKEVAAGYECGITIENYNDIKVGDVIEAYEIQEVSPV